MAVSDLLQILQKIVLLTDKVDRLGRNYVELSRRVEGLAALPAKMERLEADAREQAADLGDVRDRVLRIETLIEFAQGAGKREKLEE